MLGPMDLTVPAPVLHLGMEPFVGSGVRVQTTSVTELMVVTKAQVTSFVVTFEIRCVLYMSVHWIKMHFLFLPLSRKIECSVSASWLQNKSKSICVKSGWYLFSTGYNACGYKIRKYKFSAWHEIRQYNFSAWHQIRQYTFSTQNSTKVVIAR